MFLSFLLTTLAIESNVSQEGLLALASVLITISAIVIIAMLAYLYYLKRSKK